MCTGTRAKAKLCRLGKLRVDPEPSFELIELGFTNFGSNSVRLVYAVIPVKQGNSHTSASSNSSSLNVLDSFVFPWPVAILG